jgi:ABC-2 type transport system permease protein
MRVVSLFRKTLIENIRDWKILIVTLTFAPLFVLLMYFYVGETTQSSYRVLVVNRDAGVSGSSEDDFNAGSELIHEMMNMHDSEGRQILEVTQELDWDTAHNQLMNNTVDLVVEIPENFSSILVEFSQGNLPDPVIVQTYGDPTKANYLMAAVWNDMITYEYAASIAGLNSPLEIQVNTITGKQALNEFELYVPALLALALMMLMFTAAASIIKEKDEGTIIRLRAAALGYETSGSLAAMMFVGFLSSLSIIAISLIVAAYLRTIFDLMTIGCFPFFILMFFSGGMFPLPPLRLFTVGERAININDILPTTHTINAMSKILSYDAGLQDVVFELGAISILTIVLFAVGVWVFTRRHMRAGA